MTHEQYVPKDFFISDLHYGHVNVISHCDRPFKGMEDMHLTLVHDWNAVVSKQDRVHVLGDFSFYSPETTTKLLSALNGQKTLVKGNHDHSKDNRKVKGWNQIESYVEKRFGQNQTRVCMSHFPMLSWHQMHRGSVHLHGHCHGSLRLPEWLQRARIMDVGVDHLYKLQGHWGPIQWEVVEDFLQARVSATSDHHVVKPNEPLSTEEQNNIGGHMPYHDRSPKW